MNIIEIGDNVYINRGCQFYTSAYMGKKVVQSENLLCCIKDESRFIDFGDQKLESNICWL